MADHSGHHQTFFSIGVDVPILFQPWNLNTKTGLFLTCIGSAVLGVLYQGIKCLRQYAHRGYGENRGTIKSREHVLQTILYFIQMISSYVLMLIVMTFNAWAFLSTVAGLGLGYFLCGWAYPDTVEYVEENTCSKSCHSEKCQKQEEQEVRLLRNTLNDCEETVL